MLGVVKLIVIMLGVMAQKYGNTKGQGILANGQGSVQLTRH
jgi:hypothetical protein